MCGIDSELLSGCGTYPKTALKRTNAVSGFLLPVTSHRLFLNFETHQLLFLSDSKNYRISRSKRQMGRFKRHLGVSMGRYKGHLSF